MNTERTDSDDPRHFALTPAGLSTLRPGDEHAPRPGPGTMIEIDDPDRPELKGHWVVKAIHGISDVDVVPYGSVDATKLLRAKAKRERKAARRVQ
jgi:hypothetical protein